jgi:antitoxin MazE
MASTTVLGKWGNSQAVRIPQPFLEQLDLHLGDKLSLKLCGNHIELEKFTEEAHTLKARMKGWDGERFETTEYDWGGPVGSEVW